MKTFLLTLLFIALPHGIFAGNSKPIEVFNLEKSVDLALKNNAELLSAFQNLLIAKQRIKEARFLSFPQISFSGAVARFNLQYPMVLPQEFGGRYLNSSIDENFYALRIYAFQPVYTGGRNKSTLKITKTAEKEAKVKYETVKRKAIFSVKKIFYTLLYREKLLEIHKKWSAEFTRISPRVRKKSIERIETGVIASQIESDGNLYEKEYKLALNRFKKELGTETNFPIKVEGTLDLPEFEINLKKSLVTAMEMRPELRGEIYKAKIDEIAVNLAMIKRHPKIYLGASYDILGYDMFNRQSPSYSNWLASIAIQFPLSWDFWTKVRQEKAKQRQGELKRSALRDEIRFEVIQGNEEVKYWRKEFERRKKNFNTIKSAYLRYVRKTSFSMETLRLLKILYESNKKYLEASYHKVIAGLKLELAQGKDLGD